MTALAVQRTPAEITAESVWADRQRAMLERRRIAEHEIGHAIVAASLGWGLGEITVVARGDIAGLMYRLAAEGAAGNAGQD